MSSPAVLGADASRPRSGILTPSSDASLNYHRGKGHLSSEDGGNRNRDDVLAMDHLLKPSVVLKPHPPNIHIQPRVLVPLMLLPRQQFSLSYIDFDPSRNDASPSRFFESHVKILDLESRLESTPSVLIARSESRGTMHALERQDSGLYVVCQLGPWVDLGDLERKATAISRDRLHPAKADRSDQDVSSQATTTPQLYKDHKRKRAAIEAIQTLVKKRARSQSISTLGDATKRNENACPNMTTPQSQLPSPDLKLEQQPEPPPLEDVPPVLSVLNSAPAEDRVPQQTKDGIFESIRNHYFDTLYRSMGSLAYFAKGPLSRARSAFHLDLEANLDMADLIDFLKSLILTTVQIDKKYRESIPAIIAKSRDHLGSSDEGQKKKRKPKKMKLGKDGLYPAEEESVHQWWDANKPELKNDEVKISEAQIKSHFSLLRTRETQLQMMIILEILALEPLKAQEETGESSLPSLPGTDVIHQSNVNSPAPPPKKRNKHNLPVLVDVHADRLTIWQSTATEEQLLLEDSQANRQTTEEQLQKSSSEPLRDFCVDVIVPFFSARLLQLCDSINRKLGGPVIVSPPKSKTNKQSSREQKPGSATRRLAPVKTQRTLQRALSTEQLHRRSVSRGPSNAIALLRSATSTSLAGVKREGSEPLGHRGARDDIDQLQKRPISLLSRSNSVASIEDTKASKKAKVEAELKDAISALRKPNRDVVSKAMAEAAQHRTAASSSMKKSRKHLRGSLGAAVVQVKATPANNRFRNVLGVRSENAVEAPVCISEDEVIPPSSIGPLVPSTIQKRPHKNAVPGSASSDGMDTVGSTPIKPSMRTSFIRRPVDEEPAIPPSSPLAPRNARQEMGDATPAGKGLCFERRDSAAASNTIMWETPIKRAMPRSTPNNEPSNVPGSVEKGMSIYQRLGWDDEFDDM